MEDISKKSPTPGSESSSGFRSFWKKKTSKAAAKAKDFGITSKEKEQSSSSSPNPKGGGAEAGKRRQQVYQAQKRHRNRRAEYVKDLEAQVAKLQKLDSAVTSEKNALAHQNQMMRELLASHAFDFDIQSLDLNHLAPRPATTTTTTVPPVMGQTVSKSSPAGLQQLSPLGAAKVEVRHDPEIGHERTFLDVDFTTGLDFDDMAGTSATEERLRSSTPPAQQKSPMKGDAWAAVDFILALEWCCQGHMPHSGIYPGRKRHCEFVDGEEDGPGFHGHALTTTAAVLEGALPPADGSTTGGEGSEKWQLPHSEIDKLVRMAENLPIDDEKMTPAQAYSAIKDAIPGDEFLRPVLEAMKVPLSSCVACEGFGAVMPTEKFRACLDSTLLTLKSGAVLQVKNGP